MGRLSSEKFGFWTYVEESASVLVAGVAVFCHFFLPTAST